MPGVARDDGLPAEEVLEQQLEGRRGIEFVAGRLDIAMKPDDRAGVLTAPTEAELVAVGIEEVRQRLQLLPLRLVVRVTELPRIGPLARGLDLNEPDEHPTGGHRVVGPGLELADCRLPDGRHLGPREPAQFRHVEDEEFQRRAELVLRLAVRPGVPELRPGTATERRNGRTEGQGHREFSNGQRAAVARDAPLLPGEPAK